MFLVAKSEAGRMTKWLMNEKYYKNIRYKLLTQPHTHVAGRVPYRPATNHLAQSSICGQDGAHSVRCWHVTMFQMCSRVHFHSVVSLAVATPHPV